MWATAVLLIVIGIPLVLFALVGLPHHFRNTLVRNVMVASARRGVDVRVLTNGAQSDVKTTWLAGRSRYEVLLAAGVRIYEYRPTTIHSKTIVVDGT